MFKNPIALLALAAGGFLLLKNKQTSTVTPPVTPGPYTPPIVNQGQQMPQNYLQQGANIIGQASQIIGAGKDLFGQIFPHKSAPIAPPISSMLPSNPAGAGGAGGIAFDRWGIPHARQDSVDRANAGVEWVGKLYRAISDSERIFFEDIEALVDFEITRSGHSWNQVVEYLQPAPQARIRQLVVDYNSLSGKPPIVARG